MKKLNKIYVVLLMNFGLFINAQAEITDTDIVETKAIVTIMMEMVDKCETHECMMEFYNEHSSPEMLVTINESDQQTAESMLKGAKILMKPFVENLNEYEISGEEIAEDKMLLVYTKDDGNGNTSTNKFSFVKINGKWKLG